jgi:DNA-binding MarR family transcriptional regulator
VTDLVAREARARERSGDAGVAIDACVDALTHVTPRMARLWKSQLREGPLTLPQLYMLREIRDGARPSELARRCGISSSATTAALDGLVRDGYCVRTHGEKDRREVLVHVTPAGLEALEEAERATAAACRDLLQDWDETRLGRLLAALQDLGVAVDAHLELAGR